MAKENTIAEKCLEFTGLYEAELLVELMLRYWRHPRCDDMDFRANLLDAASELLLSAVGGKVQLRGIPSSQTSLVLGIWLAESIDLANDNAIDSIERPLRDEWLHSVRRAIPSCFCDPSALDPS